MKYLQHDTWFLHMTAVHEPFVCHLEVGDVELCVGGQVVGAGRGHHQLVPGLLAGLLPRSRDQPELCHGCWQKNTVCPPNS